MMAQKAVLFRDEDSRARILEAHGPKDAKQLGRQVKNFNEEISKHVSASGDVSLRS